MVRSSEATRMSLIESLTRHRLVAIIRGNDADAAVDTALALADEGIELLEVSLTSADALSVLERVAKSIGSSVRLGAGTVLNATDVPRVRDTGATYVVTPALAPSVPAAVELGMPVLCGSLTPSEVVAAMAAGVDAVKIFPASAFGPGYFGDLRAPFPDVPFVAVGGVGSGDVAAYLENGAVAVGVASPLCGDAPDGGDLTALRDRARAFVAATRRTHDA